MYYSFYLDWKKTQLVYRIEDVTVHTGIGETVVRQYTESVGGLFDMSQAKQFLTEEGCRADFRKILFDNEDFRFGEIYGNKPEKKIKEKTKKEKTEELLDSIIQPIIKDQVDSMKNILIKPTYENIPERNIVYNEDCLLTMSRMPDCFVDHIITSPPYNVGKRISFGKNNQIYAGDENMYSEGYGDDMTADEYEEWLFKVIRECIRVTKRHVFFNIQMLAKNKRTVLRIHGEFANQIKDKIIWVKDIAAPNIDKGIMRSRFEDIFIFSNEKPESRSFPGAELSGSFSNVIEGMNASKNKFRKYNKATFPLYLPRTLLIHFCSKGELVYDPFNGTGTTADSCVVEKFDYIGSELDPEQCRITNQRVKDKSAIQEFNFG